MNLFDAFGASDPQIFTPPVALTISRSDSGGGGGVQADLKTFAAAKVHGASVVTLVDAHMLPVDVVLRQLESVIATLPVAAVKTGALASARMIEVVAEALGEWGVETLVVDPVMMSKHADPLLPQAAQRAFVQSMLPLALLVTPNRYEAEVLSGRSVEGPGSMKDAAKAIFDRGARNVLVKGAHLERIVRDIFYDGSGFVELGADRIDTEHLHGSGCVHSAAITARLAHGAELLESIGWAREFVSGAIAAAQPLGDGISPVQPMFDLWS